ncbi:MAG TPA: hypothetical protein VGH86_01380 [Phenylobacterium sp.]|jgi:hypothetical protein
MSRPSRRHIEAEDQRMLRRQADFRLAAGYVADDLARCEDVQAITLIGSVARPLRREVPRFQPFRRHGALILHECGDIDLAVWVSRLDRLPVLARARSTALKRLLAERSIGVAHHQAELFLFEPGTDAYLGRLCTFNTCPKGHADCETPGCGREPFLKQHEAFRLYADALAEGRCVRLWQRGEGWLAQDGG